MIKVEKVAVWGFEHAIRGMRNPMNSWDKSDTLLCGNVDNPDLILGKNDLTLMQKLYKAGAEHRTYARMIQVSMDITAPLYWWKEMDRYTVGKSQVSCSTMHKIAAKEFDHEDFSCEHLLGGSFDVLDTIISALNEYRILYQKADDNSKKMWWWQIIQLLPSSYNQKRTICMSYETVFKIIKERTGHKLTEWEDFVALLHGLPHVEEIIDGSET